MVAARPGLRREGRLTASPTSRLCRGGEYALLGLREPPSVLAVALSRIVERYSDRPSPPMSTDKHHENHESQEHRRRPPQVPDHRSHDRSWERTLACDASIGCPWSPKHGRTLTVGPSPEQRPLAESFIPRRRRQRVEGSGRAGGVPASGVRVALVFELVVEAGPVHPLEGLVARGIHRYRTVATPAVSCVGVAHGEGG